MYRIRLRVHFHPWVTPLGVLTVMLVAVVALAMLTMNLAHAITPGSPARPSTAHGMRQFYLSTSWANGMDADTVCAGGYHFASMWEIADPSNLRYNTSLGMISSDSGAGPPSQQIGFPSPVPARGWVRTGYTSSTAANSGKGNCAAWTSGNGAHSGTVDHLVSDWTGGDEDVGPWNAEVRTCDYGFRVWCVQDHGLLPVFLPLVLKG